MNLYDIFDSAKPVVITYELTDSTSFSFVIDCTVNLTHSNNATVTEFPIETGASINDHVIKQSRVLTLSGFITDTPYQLFSFNLPFSTADKISKKAYDIFQEIYNNKYLVSVETDLEKYENMFIESMSFPRSKDTQKTLEFTLNMKQLTFVESKISNLPDDHFKQDTVSKATGKKQTDAVKPTETIPPTKDKTSSVLFKLGAI